MTIVCGLALSAAAALGKMNEMIKKAVIKDS